MGTARLTDTAWGTTHGVIPGTRGVALGTVDSTPLVMILSVPSGTAVWLTAMVADTVRLVMVASIIGEVPGATVADLVATMPLILTTGVSVTECLW